MPSSSSLRRRRPLAVAVLLLLAIVACDEADACDESAAAPTVRQEVEAAYGIDTHDSNQVGGAIASGETLGNKEASDGLTAVLGIMPADAEYQGDHAYPGVAIEKYKEALRWNKLTPGKEWDYYADRARILEKLSTAYRRSAEGAGPRDWKEEMEAAARATAVAAARELGRKAQAKQGVGEPATADPAEDYMRASDLYAQAGRVEAACESLRRSRQVGLRSWNQESAWCREIREGG